MSHPHKPPPIKPKLVPCGSVEEFIGPVVEAEFQFIPVVEVDTQYAYCPGFQVESGALQAAEIFIIQFGVQFAGIHVLSLQRHFDRKAVAQPEFRRLPGPKGLIGGNTLAGAEGATPRHNGELLDQAVYGLPVLEAQQITCPGRAADAGFSQQNRGKVGAFVAIVAVFGFTETPLGKNLPGFDAQVEFPVFRPVGGEVDLRQNTRPVALLRGALPVYEKCQEQ